MTDLRRPDRGLSPAVLTRSRCTTCPLPTSTRWERPSWTGRSTTQQNIFFRYAGQKWTTSNDQLGSIFSSDGSAGQQRHQQLPRPGDPMERHHFADQGESVHRALPGFCEHDSRRPAQQLHLSGGRAAERSPIPTSPSADGTTVGTNVNVPQETLIRKYQFSDNFTWTHGTHNFKIGANWIYFAKMGGYFYSGLGYFMTFWDDPACIQAGSCAAGSADFIPRASRLRARVARMSYSRRQRFDRSSHPGVRWACTSRMTGRFRRGLTLNLGIRWDANIDFLQSAARQHPDQQQQGSLGPAAGHAESQLPHQRSGRADDFASGRQYRQSAAHHRRLEGVPASRWVSPGTSPEPASICCAADTASPAIRSSRTSRCCRFSRRSRSSTRRYSISTSSNAPGARQPAPVPRHGPVNLCTFRFGVTPLPVPPPPTQTDLALERCPELSVPTSPIHGRSSSASVMPGRSTTTMRSRADYVHILGTHEERVLNQNPLISTVCDPAYGGNPANPRCVAGTGTRLMDYAFQQTGAGCGTLCPDLRLQHQQPLVLRRHQPATAQAHEQALHVPGQRRDLVVACLGRLPGGVVRRQRPGRHPAAAVRAERVQLHQLRRAQPFRLQRRLQFAVGILSLSPIFTAASARPYSFLAGTDINGDGRVGPRSSLRAAAPSTDNPDQPLPGCTMIKPNTLRGIPFVQMNLRVDKSLQLRRADAAVLCTGSSTTCSTGPTSATATRRAFGGRQRASTHRSRTAMDRAMLRGGVSGFAAAAVPSFSSQFGFRFSF